MKKIRTIKPYFFPEDSRRHLKLKPNDAFFYIPGDVLEKYNVRSFELIVNDRKNLTLVGVQTPKQASTPHLERGDIIAK